MYLLFLVSDKILFIYIIPESIPVCSFIDVAEKLVSPRRKYKKLVSGDSLALQLGGDNNIKKRESDNMSFMVNNVR